MSRRLLPIALLVPALYWGWGWFLPDDDAQVRAVLERIATAIESGGAGGAQGLARVAALQEDFAVDATVDAGPPFQRLMGRQAIVGAAARVRVGVSNLDIDFPDIDIDVSEDRRSATALVTAEAHFDDAGSRSMDARELEIAFTRTEGRWVISSVVLIQPLKRL